MNSMTGYGRGEAARGGAKFTVEISTVNRKQAELSLYLPRELDALESRARDEINAKVSRGRIAARVQWTAKSGDRAQVEIDRNLAKEYAKEYRKLATDLKLGGEVSLDTILRAPACCRLPRKSWMWNRCGRLCARPCVRLSRMLAMRAREGANLKKDLQKRIDALQKSVKAVKRQAPKTVRRHREALLDRLNQSGLDLKLDDERVLKEVALFADRIDITEELTRLESHFGQFADYAKPRGRSGARWISFRRK